MSLSQAFLQEFDTEAKTTRRWSLVTAWRGTPKVSEAVAA